MGRSDTKNAISETRISVADLELDMHEIEKERAAMFADLEACIKKPPPQAMKAAEIAELMGRDIKLVRRLLKEKVESGEWTAMVYGRGSPKYYWKVTENGGTP